ncbi:MAG: HyaD/HybD family hydrogenase maturation endopeptidase [Dehalococcoidia bacterium]
MNQSPRESEVEKPTPHIVVIGVGNLLLKDEGVGVHAIRALQEVNLPQNVTIMDGGTAPDLSPYIRSGDKLIIIDAAKAGGQPGTIHRFRPQDLSTDNMGAISAHELGIEQNLTLMAMEGKKPSEVVIIGIEPKEIDWGTDLSPELQSAIPEIVEVLLKEIDSHREACR